MTDLKNQILQIPYHDTVACPLCGQGIPIIASVALQDGSTRHVGTKGFQKQIIVNVDANLKSISFSHECEYKDETND